MKYTLVNSATKQTTEFQSYSAGAKALRQANNGYFLQGPRRAFFFDDVQASKKNENLRDLLQFCWDLVEDDTIDITLASRSRLRQLHAKVQEEHCRKVKGGSK